MKLATYKLFKYKTQFFDSVFHSFHCSARKLPVLSSALCVSHLNIKVSSIILLERMEKETYIKLDKLLSFRGVLTVMCALTTDSCHM